MAFNIVRNGKKISLTLEEMEKASKAFEEVNKPKHGDLIMVRESCNNQDTLEFGIFDEKELESDGQLGSKNGYCLGYINGKNVNGMDKGRVATIVRDKKLISLLVPLIKKHFYKE